MGFRRMAAAALAAAWLSAGGLGLGGARPARAAESAVVLAYSRFGDDRYPSASVRPDQFEAHIAELAAEGMTVLPLPAVVAALGSGRPLPDRAIALTIDGATPGLYDFAWPRLRAAGYPFTLFIATDSIDHGTESLSWAQVREMASSGLVTIGSQGAAGAPLAELPAEAVAADLGRARQRFLDELGRAPTLLAWPRGETSAVAMAAARDAGFTAAFGQQSGVAWGGANLYFLPRFALNELFAEPDRFRLAIRALPLPVSEITPDDPVVAINPPAFGFTLADETMAAGLACYSSAGGRMDTEIIGPRIEVRAAAPFPSGRVRLNCTLPALDGRWRWFGWQFVVP
jgi:peptidoglycan/xylan/chitin deacetylase (PgdA/CDA1 family)